MLDIRRREFITLLGGAAAAWPFAGRAQQAEKGCGAWSMGHLGHLVHLATGAQPKPMMK